MKRTTLVIIAILLTLTACTAGKSAPSSSNQQDENVIQNPLPDLTIPPRFSVDTNCVEPQTIPFPEAGMSGNLILEPFFDSWFLEPLHEANEFTHILDLKTGESVPLGVADNEELNQFAVSPNGEFLAYRKWKFETPERNMSEVKDNRIVILDYAGNLVTTIPARYVGRSDDGDKPFEAEEGNWQSFYWLNEQQLIIKLFSIPFDRRLVLNPFTKEQQEFTINYDSVDPLEGSGFVWYSKIAFDSSLTHVVYPGKTAEDFKSSLVLWDLNNDRVVQNFQTVQVSLRALPQWSPDDSQVVFAMWNDVAFEEELFSIGRDGQAIQVTQFNDLYDEPINVGAFKWSPDSEMIAFRFNDRISVLDVRNRVVTDYCITTEGFFAHPPIWSPDGQFIAFANTDKDKTVQVIVIDIYENLAFSIAEDAVPVGWLANGK